MAAGGFLYPGPTWFLALPCEDALRYFERDAFGVLLEAGVLNVGDLVPWRGYRREFLERRFSTPEHARGSFAVGMAWDLLHAVEEASARNFSEAFEVLAWSLGELFIAERFFAEESRYASQRASGELRRLDRKGRPAALSVAQKDSLCEEALRMRRANPRLAVSRIADRLRLYHPELAVSSRTIERAIAPVLSARPARESSPEA